MVDLARHTQRIVAPMFQSSISVSRVLSNGKDNITCLPGVKLALYSFGSSFTHNRASCVLELLEVIGNSGWKGGSDWGMGEDLTNKLPNR